MANLNAFYASEASPWAIDATKRAIDAWHRIQANSSSIVLARNGVDQAAQTVRIEFDDGSKSDVINETGRAGQRELIIFGVKDHPTIATTNIRDDDTFRRDGLIYEIKSVLHLPGEIQARALMRTK